MKTYKIIKIIFTLTLALFTANGCTDDYVNMNLPTDLVTEDVVDIGLILTYAQYRGIVNNMSSAQMDRMCGYIVSGAGSPFEESPNSGVWNKGYKEVNNNLTEIIRLTEDDPELINMRSIARIMKVWYSSIITDAYGNTPYSEATLPFDEVVYNPGYDLQENIYIDLFKELKEAVADLDSGKESFGPADLIYGGDPAKWKKFGNSLRLRLALRVYYTDEALAKENVEDLEESDLILSRDEDASIFTLDDVADNRNTRFVNITRYGDGSDFLKNLIGKTLLDNLQDNNDPRLKIYADTAKATFPGYMDHVDYFGYRGMPLMDGSTIPQEQKYPYGHESVSRLSDWWYVPEIEMPVLKCSEVYFSLAEACLLNLTNIGTANDYFRKGIQASMDWTVEFYEQGASQITKVTDLLYDWEAGDGMLEEYLDHKKITENEINDFIQSPAASLTGDDENKIEQIMVQKNITLFPNGYEGWAEWRRTGYPRILISADNSAIGPNIPRRLGWPDDEMLLNEDNYNAALEIYGSNSVLVKMWWDVNPSAPHEHPGEVERMDTAWLR